MRLRTLPASVAPVLVGIGAAWQLAQPDWKRAGLALVVAVTMQVGANFANDYSDGMRGTDSQRQGPQRLVGSGSARPAAVKAAAILAFTLSGAAGLYLCYLTGHWWLAAIGLACVLLAWTYTGGRRPYGYAGLGEVGVFICFGLVATLGTMYVVASQLTWRAGIAAIAMGLLACAILMANNLRDLATDKAAGKKTLAVRLGNKRARLVYQIEVWLAMLLVVPMAVGRWHLLVVLLAALPTAKLAGAVNDGVRGQDLVTVLRGTGQVQLMYGILLGLALANLNLWPT
ncbi:MAG: 1,4-dihydroxy-2-naphthoate polyprenyltransferase [Micrococcales bacterium]|nr:1,4-dihydroxy-2-naphthoate polyprenyltransferase [Micrococcales bacterium]